MIKVILIIAHTGYQPVEYGDTKDVLEKAGVKVITASNKSGIAKSSDNKSQAKIDITIDQIEPKDYSGIFLIGGPGALENLDNKKVHDLIKKTSNLNIPFGAICIAPRILAVSEVLENKNATGWNEDGELDAIFKKYKINYIKKPAVTDGHIVTATGPSAAKEFGQAILKVIK